MEPIKKGRPIGTKKPIAEKAIQRSVCLTPAEWESVRASGLSASNVIRRALKLKPWGPN